MPPKGAETANTTGDSEAEKTKLTNSADNKGETQDVINKTTGELSAVQNNIVETKTAALSAKVDAKPDRPTRKELREEKKELREERRDDKQLDRLIGRVNKEISKTSVSKQRLNKTMFDNNLLMMNLEDLRNFNDYLMKVRNKKIDPATEKFQPQNLESFKGLLVQMPYIRGYIDFVTVEGKTAKVGSKIEYGVVQGASQSNDNFGSKIPRKLETSFEKGGVLGALNGWMDQTKMSPQQKQFRNGTSNLLVMGGAVFVGWKMLSSAFKLLTNKEERTGAKLGGNLAWLAIPAGLTFAANATSGGNLMDLFKGGKLSEKVADWMGIGSGAEGKTDFSKTYNEGFSSIGAIFGGLNFGQIKQVVEKDTDGGIKLTQAGKDQLKSTYSLNPNDEKSKLALKLLGKNSTDKNINLGLNALVGSYDELMQKTDSESFDKLYAENIVRFTELDNYVKEHNLKTINVDEYKKEITEYIKTGKPTLEELEKMGAFLEEKVEIAKDLKLNKIEAIKSRLEKKGVVEIKIGEESAKLLKGSTTGETIIKSESGKTTKIDLTVPSIIGLGTKGSDGKVTDRKIIDKDNNNDYYSTISIAHKLNKIKNGYESRISASGAKPFEFTDGKIRFNETKDGGGINRLNVMDDGYIGGLFSDFPAAFKDQEENLVNYLNNTDNLKEINIKEQEIRDIINDLDKSKNIKIKFIENPTDQKITGIESHGYTCAIDIDQMMIKELPNRRFKNHLELIGAANLINVFKEILKNKPAQSTENPIYIGLDGNVAFNDRNLYEEMKSIRNRGADGIGDIDVVKSGDLTFRKNNSLKTISPTLYDHRVEFLRYLNKNGTFQEKISESTERTKLKEKVNNLQNTDKLKVQIGDDSIELQKNGSLSNVNVISSEGKTTTVNFEKVTIKGLGSTNGTTVVDRKFTDPEGHNNYLELLVTANALNNIKNKYEDKIYAAGLSAPGKNPGFKYESKDKKIYFNESKEGGGIIKDAAMDDGIFFSDFPESFKGQENQIVTYLNNEVVINPESPDRVLEYFKARGMDVTLTNPVGPATDVESHGNATAIDLTTKKIDGLDRKFQNHLELIGAANLINAITKILNARSAVSKDGVYVGLDGDIAFNDKTIFEEMKTYFNEGLHGYGDTDLVQGGDLMFWKKNTLKDVSPTLYANRREFVNYLNNMGIYNAETRQLQEKKARIEKALNNGMRTPITFSDGGMEYDEQSKELTITAINEDSLSNDQMVNNNLGNIENFVSRYNILESEDVKKIILPNINLEPGKSVSVKYLKKLLDLDEKKIQLGPDFLANREMIEFVAKKHDEGKFTKEENSKIDMNGIITLNYIYDSGYDFNRLFNGEDDSRVDFAMRVMELLAGHRTIVDPTKKSIVELDKNIVKTPIKLPAGDDPIMKIRRVSKGENVDFGFSKNRQRRKNSDNIDIMNKIIENIHRYATQNPPIENVPYILPA